MEDAACRLNQKLESCANESQLLAALGPGLAEVAHCKYWRLGKAPNDPQAQYSLSLVPVVGESTWVHLAQKHSGDHFRKHDREILQRVCEQAERHLLKLRNEALRIERAAAERLAREKSLFLAAASHDLRQPMHALSLFSESLLLRNKDGELQDLVQKIQRSTSNLSGMFNAILDMSKLDAGVVTVDSQPVALQVLFEEIEVEFSTRAA